MTNRGHAAEIDQEEAQKDHPIVDVLVHGFKRYQRTVAARNPYGFAAAFLFAGACSRV